ncbi:hypothetical protein C8R46DRAFT_971700 [Mycena filopes]|nr:hypothetical protein C8R46DRAFT_82724 [Mycena filopes]KAJ7129938.1 hypothetical protein C8R46DRAFT_971700 [Mycena filopes]
MPKPSPRRSPRKHDQKAKKGAKGTKAGKEPTLPSIKWVADDGALTWALIEQMEVKQNRLVLFGKQDKSENTSGDSKTAVFKRIGSVILPDLYAIAPNSLGKRVKGKAEALVDLYKEHAKRLQVTGGGLRKNEESIGETEADATAVHQYLACYISPQGPDHDTTGEARNLWDQIVEDFEYFPALHKFLAARSNIVPPVIATGVGPKGRQVIHLQAPTAHDTNDDNIDPALRDYKTPVRPTRLRPRASPAVPAHDSSPIYLDSSPVAPPKGSRGKTAAQASTFPSTGKSKYGKRPSFEDSLISIQSKMMESANRREQHQLANDRARLRIEEINQCLSLHNLGVLDKDQLRARIAIVEERYADPIEPKRKRSESPDVPEAGPSKRPTHSRSFSSSST